MWTYANDIPRAQADAALAITDTLPAVSLDVGEHPTDADLYRLTWWGQNEDAEAFGAALQARGWASEPPALMPVDTTVDYVALMRAQFPPLVIGKMFIARNDEPCPEGLLKLDIMPNRAFGSGEHATTTACLTLLQELLAARTFSHTLDVGTGSGILALAAAKLAGMKSVGTDNDAASVQIAAQNATTNGLGDTLTAVEDEDLTHPAVIAAAPYPLIMANILLQPLCDLAPRLAALLAEDGVLMTSGTTADQLPTLQETFAPHGLTLVKALSVPQGDYVWQGVLWEKGIQGDRT